MLKAIDMQRAYPPNSYNQMRGCEITLDMHRTGYRKYLGNFIEAVEIHGFIMCMVCHSDGYRRYVQSPMSSYYNSLPSAASIKPIEVEVETLDQGYHLWDIGDFGIGTVEINGNKKENMNLDVHRWYGRDYIREWQYQNMDFIHDIINGHLPYSNDSQRADWWCRVTDRQRAMMHGILESRQISNHWGVDIRDCVSRVLQDAVSREDCDMLNDFDEAIHQS